MSNNNSLQEQRNNLINIFNKPVSISLHKNNNNNNDNHDNNDNDDDIKECCKVALTYFNSLLLNQHGLFGALASLSSKFKWGFSRCEHVCECVSNADNLDCGSGMSLALKLLKPIRGHYLLASVELIITHSKFNTTIWKHRISEENPDMTPEELALKTIWIQDDCHYHTCIGLISNNQNENSNELQLKVWDFGLWILPSYSPNSLTAKLAIRVKIDRENNDFTPSSPSSSEPLTFQWGKHSIIEDTWTNLFDLDELRSSPNTVTTNNTTPTPTLCTPPQIFISGCHVSGSPCPGIGLARSIRVIYPEARLTGVDTVEDLSTGVSDPIFNSRLSLPGVMAPSFSGSYSDWQVLQWDLVYDLLTSDPRAIYLPSRDSDIDIISSSLDKFIKDHEPPKIRKKLPKGTPIFDQDLSDRILSPPLDALDAMAKPSIYGACNSNPIASSKGCYALGFQIPEFLDLSNGDVSLYELQHWCNETGYPIIVKGSRQGAYICSSWVQVTAALTKDSYVQKFVVGFSMGLCFAAYKGELLGAVLMQKNVVTSEGKAWGGELRNVPHDMLNDLRLFCKSTNFTGGSELEYVEDMNGINWAIDWNPRFPAYIYACTLAGINLPALLIAYCLQDLEKRNTYNIFRKSNLTTKEQDLLKSSRFLTLPKGYEINFSRMVVETIDVYGSSNRTGGGGTMTFTSYSGKSRHQEYKTDDKQCQRKNRFQLLPNDIEFHNNNNDNHDNNDNNNDENNNHSSNSVIKTLQTDLSFFMSHTPQNNFKTPYYVLSTSAASLSLKTQKDTLDNILTHWKQLHSATNNTIDQNVVSNLIIQPFLSVKTQPHQSLLQTARECGFYAECITIAEIRASLAAGFKDEQIILTGPGKFWFGPDIYEMPKQLNLRAIFADSLEDLKHIINLVTDPNSWLQTQIIGVRLSLGGISRFGINSSDPQTILDTAICLKCLPNHFKIGFHFHHASSNLGPSAWWNAVESFLSLTSSISSVSGKSISILDFGGGWQPHFLNFKETESNMINLFNKMLKFHPHIEAIQFEPGKSVSERSGALICRVLEIRELSRPKDLKYPISILNNNNNNNNNNNEEEEDNVSLDENKSVIKNFDRRACIVDACIAELSVNSLHVHPLFWKSKNSSNNDNWSKLDHDGISKGTDALWGRSCMEFDILSSNIILPPDIQIGDYVMIAFCGAYDNVMQYDFADGLGRELQIIN